MAKIRLEDIQKEIQENGWKIISTEYKNLNSELELICPEGHKVFIPYGKWRKNHQCPICESNPMKNISKEIIPKKKGTHRVLAIDDATKTSGWAVFDDKELISYGKYSVNKTNYVENIIDTKNWVINMVNEWQPDIVAIEDIQLQQIDGRQQSVTVFKTLAKLQGALEITFHELGIKYEIVHVSKWRVHCGITGKYRADRKKSAQLKIKKWYDVSVTQDEADAICIGKCVAEKSDTMIQWG